MVRVDIRADRSREAGLTLVEAVVAIVVLAVAVGLSAPLYRPLIASIRLNDAVGQLVTDLRATQQAAMGQTVAYRISFSSTAYSVERGNGAGGFGLVKQVVLPPTVTITSPPPPVVFAASGAATGQQIRLRNAQNAWRDVTVASVTGRVSVTAP